LGFKRSRESANDKRTGPSSFTVVFAPNDPGDRVLDLVARDAEDPQAIE